MTSARSPTQRGAPCSLHHGGNTAHHGHDAAADYATGLFLGGLLIYARLRYCFSLRAAVCAWRRCT